MDKASFDDYITRFNRRDTTAFEDYLADDMHMKNGTLEYDGVQGMKDRFTAESDDPESLFGPVLEGETFEFRGVISYRLDEDGRFADILVAYNSFTGTRRDGSTIDLGLPALMPTIARSAFRRASPRPSVNHTPHLSRVAAGARSLYPEDL